MRRSAQFLFILALVAVSSPTFANGAGHIQVKCAPGVQIFMDGTLQGVTSSDVGGLIIQDVATGTHEIKAIKAGYQPQIESITVAPGQVASFEVELFIPKVKITETGTEQETQVKLKVGSLQIQSLPIECALKIPALGIDGQRKTKDQWVAEGVPVGTYSIVASAMGKQLSHTVAIEENFRSEVMFNFVSGEISDPSAERRAAERAARDAREREVARIREQAREAGITLPAGMVFVPVKPGTFTMGSPEDETGRESDEGPRRQVTLSKAIWMGAHEVMQEQYQAVMGTNPSMFKGPKRPVEQVSWDDAMDFVSRLNQRERAAGNLPAGWSYRLPTEAEWEYCCRAGSQTAYCFGNGSGQLGDYAWFADNSGSQTHDVGTRQPNAWGLYDMHGNVWEWCADWYGSYSAGSESDPAGPATGSYRMLRGGSWDYAAARCRSADRFGIAPGLRSSSLGFRVVVAPGQR